MSWLRAFWVRILAEILRKKLACGASDPGRYRPGKVNVQRALMSFNPNLWKVTSSVPAYTRSALQGRLDKNSTHKENFLQINWSRKTNMKKSCRSWMQRNFLFQKCVRILWSGECNGGRVLSHARSGRRFRPRGPSRSIVRRPLLHPTPRPEGCRPP